MNAEDQVTELRNKMEQLIASRAEEETQYKELLNQQRQTAEQCSEQVSECVCSSSSYLAIGDGVAGCITEGARSESDQTEGDPT